MRTSTILAILALFCILSIAFAADAKPTTTTTTTTTKPTNNDAQVKALQDKLAKLEIDLSTIRTTIADVKKENENLTKKVQDAASKASQPPPQVKQDPKVSELDNTVAQLRKSLQDLTAKVEQLSFTAQLKEQAQNAKQFYTTSVAPKVDQGIQMATIYATKATSAIRPLFGQTQGLLSKVYHEVRALIATYKPKFVQFVAPQIKKIPQIEAKYQPYVIDALFHLALFLSMFFVFIICYSIWAFIMRLICPCSKKSSSPQQQQQNKKQRA